MPFKKGDKNINRGGRKTKSQELGLTEKLDKIKPVGKVLKQLSDQIDKGNLKAVEVWLAYYYGKPKEFVKLDGDFNIDTLKIVRASDKRTDNK